MSLKRPGEFESDPYYGGKRVNPGIASQGGKLTFKILCPLTQAGAIIGKGGSGLQVYYFKQHSSEFRGLQN